MVGELFSAGEDLFYFTLQLDEFSMSEWSLPFEKSGSAPERSTLYPLITRKNPMIICIFMRTRDSGTPPAKALYASCMT